MSGSNLEHVAMPVCNEIQCRTDSSSLAGPKTQAVIGAEKTKHQASPYVLLAKSHSDLPFTQCSIIETSIFRVWREGRKIVPNPLNEPNHSGSSLETETALRRNSRYATSRNPGQTNKKLRTCDPHQHECQRKARSKKQRTRETTSQLMARRVLQMQIWTCLKQKTSQYIY